MATFAAYFSYGGKDGLTHNEHVGSFKTLDEAYLHLMREQRAFGEAKGANGVDFYVKSGGKRVSMDDPERFRKLLEQVVREKFEAAHAA